MSEQQETPMVTGKYKIGPITEADFVLETWVSPTCTIKHLICDDVAGLITPAETSFVPDIREELPLIKDMPVFDDDIFMIAFAKTGSHWVWEIINMLTKGCAEHDTTPKTAYQLEFHYPEEFKDMQRPRIFNTHNLLHHIPKQATEKRCKIVMVQRNPKDTVVSLYYHLKGFGGIDDKTSFSDFLAAWLKIEGEVTINWFYYTQKLQEAIYEQKDVEIYNVFFEDLKSDPVNEIRKLAKYLDVKNKSDEFIKEIAESCCFSNMKKAHESKKTEIEGLPKELFKFMIRKGEVGDWKNHFTVSENELFDKLYMERTKDLKFSFRFTLE